MSTKLFVILAVIVAALVGAAVVIHHPGAAGSVRRLPAALHGR